MDTSGVHALMPFWPGTEPLAQIVSDIQPPVRPSSVAQIATQTSERVHKIWEAAKQDTQPFPRPPSTSGDDNYSPSAVSSSPSSSDAEGEVVGSELPVYPYTSNSTGPVTLVHMSGTVTREVPESRRRREDNLDQPTPKRARKTMASYFPDNLGYPRVEPSLSRQSTGGGEGSSRRSSSRKSTSTPKPSIASPSGRKSLYDLKEQERYVTLKGKPFPVIVNVDDHSYRHITESGEQKPTGGALIPENYRPRGPRQYHCPVRGCEKVYERVTGLGGHFSWSHNTTAFNDNRDGTLSSLGPYETDANVNSFPGVIVSRNPNTIVPPPVQGQTPVYPPKPITAPSPRQPGVYLRNLLSQKQRAYNREDILFMLSLPQLRELPKVWTLHLATKSLSEGLYAIVLAFIVGEDVSATHKCTRSGEINQSIRIPPGMPKAAKTQLARVESCVSCLYYNFGHPLNPAPCSWTPAHEVHMLGWSQSIEGRSRSADSRRGLQSASLKNEESVSQSSASREVSDEEVEEEPKPESPPPRRATRKQAAQSRNDSSKMEDWEFAPGRQLDEKTGEPFAFSGPYVTSQNAIQVAEDIGFHRLRIPPGGTQHWNAKKDVLRTFDVISGKLELKVGDAKVQPIGAGGLIVLRPGMKLTAENRQYDEAVVSCYNISNYSLA
ncbi:unnamed protein product [Clonostachys rhizophaga]|uniref:C2H2-type domain-containing protein n=1 Tax=Clonostachys rhizophaga TaxID=160324 RepID=A0A9N9YEV5_9HYPO|nr:unnamed protein product [Clonostachys rhizophaga]